MAKLFLNTFMFLLVVIGSSVGSPYPSENELATDDGLTAEMSQAGGCACRLRTYDIPNYVGRSLIMGEQNANFKIDDFNDRTESIKITGPCQWILYEHTEFQGRTYIVNPGNYPSSNNWGGPGSSISSARALPAPGTTAIALFEDDEFRGRMEINYGTRRSLPFTNFNDEVTSFIITGGSWTLYANTNLLGKSVTYGPGQYFKAALNPIGGNNVLSSMKLN